MKYITFEVKLYDDTSDAEREAIALDLATKMLHHDSGAVEGVIYQYSDALLEALE